MGEPEQVIADDWRFKEKLGIGEDAFTTLKTKNLLLPFAQAVGLGGAASAVAASPFVASTFFAGPLLSALGLGFFAATPVGWVVGSGMAAGGAFLGVKMLLRGRKDKKRIVIPRFINTPLDLIATRLLEWMLPLSLKLAHADGRVTTEEMEVISDYYIAEWGYSREFVDLAVSSIDHAAASMSYEQLATSLADYCDKNRDTNRQAVVDFLLAHLQEVAEADGDVDEREAEDLQRLQEVFRR